MPRCSIENPTVPVSSENFLAFFGVQSGNLPTVTIDSALTVPAVSAAVTFLSSSMANLPLHAFRVKGDGSERIRSGIQRLLNEAPNSEWTSFGWRKYMWQQVFTGGRGVSWIERSGLNIVAIWPMDPAATQVKRVGGRKLYAFDGKAEPYRSPTPMTANSSSGAGRGSRGSSRSGGSTGSTHWENTTSSPPGRT